MGGIANAAYFQATNKWVNWLVVHGVISLEGLAAKVYSKHRMKGAKPSEWLCRNSQKAQSWVVTYIYLQMYLEPFSILKHVCDIKYGFWAMAMLISHLILFLTLRFSGLTISSPDEQSYWVLLSWIAMGLDGCNGFSPVGICLCH